MPPIEVGATRAIGAVSAELARKTITDAATAAAAEASSAGSTVANAGEVSSGVAVSATTSAALDPGQAPIDSDRVSQIRKAVESGSYPLVPARIADAMIAAGMILRSAKA